MINKLFDFSHAEHFSPIGLPSSLLELHLDDNKITAVEVEDFNRYKDLQR